MRRQRVFFMLLFCVLLTMVSCGGGVSTPSPPENKSAPVWLSDVGVTAVEPAHKALIVKFGTAYDPDGDEPIKYKLYYRKVDPLSSNDIFAGSMIKPVYGSPYILKDLENEKKYCVAVRAVDSRGKEDDNIKKMYGTPVNVEDFDRNLQRLIFKLSMLKTVCYAPTNFNPMNGIYPDDESIKADLVALYNAGFRGIVTYASDGTLYRIPRIAKEQVGFDLVIMGIWNPNSSSEKTNAKNQKMWVDGYCVGNEGLMSGRYSLLQLGNAIIEIHAATNKPVSTSETWDNYSQDVINIVHWCFPNAHPYWHGIKEATEAANWVEQVYKNFPKGDKFLCIKETGMPTDGDEGLNEESQKEFFKKLDLGETIFCYFEAYDQYWKRWAPVEPHWGLFKSDRTPKKVILP